MQIIWISASACKRTSRTDLILTLTNIFRSMLPSWKHALLTSSYAVQTETVLAHISSANQHEKSFTKTTTVRLTCSSPFPFSFTTGLNVTERKGGPWRSSLPQKQQQSPQGIPERQSPMGIPVHRAPFLTALPTDKHPPLQQLKCHFPLVRMKLLKRFLKRGIWKELN